MFKRIFDLFFSSIGLLIISPVLIIAAFFVWNQDKYSPFYISPRVGKNGRPFKMIKLRSMIKNADKSGVDSTSANDNRITPIGHFIRKFKLDDLTQLLNVINGSMSLIGPRPNVLREVDLYTKVEKKLISIKPGITDFASIVFSDEAEILRDQIDPDLAYHQLIRPGKSKLGLFYVQNRNLFVDFILIFLTALAIIDKNMALSLLGKLLRFLKAPVEIIEIASRRNNLTPTPPPGSTKIVQSR